MKKTCLVCFSFLIISDLFAQGERAIILYKDIKDNIESGLQYLANTQRKETIEKKVFKGEWQTYMLLKSPFLYLGSRDMVDDSNCFSVASIHNSLAEIYLKYPEYTKIPSILDLSFDRIMGYRNGNQYNFWNSLPPNTKLRKSDIIGQQPLVRRPTNYKLKGRFINKVANITDDADDTALAYAAIHLRKKYKPETTGFPAFNIGAIAPIFDKYRDKDRKNRHWYNYLNGNDHETGAYLTWFGEEHQFKHWNILKTIAHNITFFLPFSKCYPHPYVPYIPYGSNDIDGVVNANVLLALSLYDELNGDGARSAIKFIEKKCKRGKFERIGIYYPNRYQFPYAVSRAYSNGVNELQTSIDYLLKYLIDTQNKDGSWESRHRVNKKDILQSTAYALNALIHIGNYEQNSTLEPIENAIDFILKKSVSDEYGTHWTGGILFSGGTLVRNNLVWKSDAYTTSLILEAFTGYRAYLENKLIIQKPN